ncbi:MAG: alpha-ketoacid dehydrogenase subunit beta [Acidimicrobiia bacterium]
MTLARALTAGLHEALAGDDRVMLLGEDVAANGGVFRISDGLLEAFGPDRVVDTPVAESGIVGAAFGLAVAGMRPIAEIQFMGFSTPAYDQIVNHVARIRHRSRHRFAAPMVIRIPYGGGFGAAEHHSESWEAIYAHTPGLVVVTPSTPHDAKGLLAAAVASPDPVIFLEPIRLYRAVKEEVPEERYEVALGTAAVRREGTDVSLLTWGAMTKEVREAAAVLADEGIAAEVVDVRSLVPLDEDTVLGSVRKTGRAVIVHEAPRTAGFGAELAARIAETCLYDLLAPVERVTGWDTVFPLKRGEHHYLPSVERIVAAGRRTMGPV